MKYIPLLVLSVQVGDAEFSVVQQSG